ncbi:hypothetical protein DFP72DRAFT_881504 [Ephemerocybe angulata]|uniref:Protein kinase domain-containing protein n=1 Tax=Ephemerocybe angulata TaxID=980116 RepID=A0A8H6I8B3_9AGAR|nr:hypothetical protein DFP72DRAFT_881504 [Tulosesus angulatus]
MSASSNNNTLSRVQTRSQARSEAQPKALQSAAKPTNSRSKKMARSNAIYTKPSRVPSRTRNGRKAPPRTKSLGKAAPLNGAERTLAAPQPSSNNTSPTLPEAARTGGLERVVGTPSVSRSSRSSRSGTIQKNLDEQRTAAIADLHEPYTVDGLCLKELYNKGAASERRIKNFLVASSLYDCGNSTWVDLPQHIRAGQLRDRYMKIIQAILIGFGIAKGTREVVDTHQTTFRHCDDSTEVSNPDIAIKASGPSFDLPSDRDSTGRSVNGSIGFCNVSSVFDVKREADVTEADVDHLAVYNRQIFFEQLNRLFSRSLLLTEAHVRLVHSDRSGTYKTTPLNIHDDPCTFVRLILGLSSQHEATLGFDTSVQWTVRGGRKVAGTISTLDGLGKRVKYKLDMERSCIVAQAVRGRGTVCWHAKDREGKAILIKDSWRTDAQVPEYTFLERAKGVEGAVQMLAFEDNRVQTKNLRPASFDLGSEDFYNRTMCRVTMVRYGLPLYQFTSQRQAISALRDAIQGHYNLLNAGVLHRDIAMDNILFGEDGAALGWRGVLIDLDMAIVVQEPLYKMRPESPAGTHLYQSVSVLDIRKILSAVPHDHLDDLESIYYVLCHLLYGYEGVGAPVANAFTGRSTLALWENLKGEDASHRKLNYLMDEGPDVQPPPLYWSSACVDLCNSLHQYILPLERRDRETRQRLAEHLHRGLEQHYSDIIAMFDTALVELDRPGGEDRRREVSSSPSCSTSSVSADSRSHPSAHSAQGSTLMKRSSDGLEQIEVSAAKRQRSAY